MDMLMNGRPMITTRRFTSLASREFHTPVCDCSICRELQYAGPHSVGFLAPLDKCWNSWRWLFYKTAEGIHYLRWTGFWQRRPR